MSRKQVTKPFDWFVGIHSLEELATKQSRVCVINILGSESRKVTPVSHEYSGGNVVAGVQYGRRGELETKLGPIPVYRSVQEVLDAGHAFDFGVVYLPPLGVAQAVSDLVRINEGLKRIVIVTEKVPARDSAAVRAMCQEAGVDVIGANSLGVVNAWDHVRIGGSLGGDNPAETIQKGSIAIHSNSGNFTTTMAEYLRTAGFGVSSAVSSGKDVYIHFALPEFLWAAQNDPRTKAVVLYVEPGGYYEKIALDLLNERRLGFTKPIVCCVTGRWKKEVTRTCGHAGALAGDGEDAESKERWFDSYFGVPVFDPKTRIVSKRGVRVSSIQFVPDAVRAVFEKIDEAPDFETTGDLSLKLWLSDHFVSVPPELSVPVVRALSPYDQQITAIQKQVGAHYLRQNMADRSGVSRISSKTQVAELHGKPVLDLSQKLIEENAYFAIAKVPPEPSDIRIVNLLLDLFLQIDERRLDFVDLARENDALPNAYVASQLAADGDEPLVARARDAARFLVDCTREFGLDEETGAYPPEVDAYVKEHLLVDQSAELPPAFDRLASEVRKGAEGCVVLRLATHAMALAESKGKFVRNPYEFLIAALAASVLWKPMMEKRITRGALEDAVAYLRAIARVFACSVLDRRSNDHWRRLASGDLETLGTGFTENAFAIIFGRRPDPQELMEFRTVVGLTVTNGPGTLSAKGAKESVSARNDVSMAFVGFLSNTGRAHGGNGVEAVEFLLDTFDGVPLEDPGRRDHGIDLKALAQATAKAYGARKVSKREKQESVRPIPCVNHPVFRGQDVNVDPREQFVRRQLEQQGVYNVFLEFYHQLVQELFAEGVTKNVFCVNVDAVIAVITLKLVWKDLRAGRISRRQVQEIGFLLFLYGRAIGTAAEVADHRDRGTDMDCRTPEQRLRFVI